MTLVADPGTGTYKIEQDFPGAPGWTLCVDIAEEEGEFRLVELTIRRAPLAGAKAWRQAGIPFVGPVSAAVPPGITATMLRRIRLDDVVSDANRRLLEKLDLRHLPRPSQSSRRSDLDFAVWAARYVKQLAAGSRRPTADLANAYGLTPEKARDLVHACRARGLLTAAPPGRPGGQLTERANALLRTDKGRR